MYIKFATNLKYKCRLCFATECKFGWVKIWESRISSSVEFHWLLCFTNFPFKYQTVEMADFSIEYAKGIKFSFLNVSLLSCHMIVDENTLSISTAFLSLRIRCMLFYLKCWLHVCLRNVSFEDFEWKSSPSREWKQNRLLCDHLSFFFHHFLS